MPKRAADLDLRVDLERGVVPISKAASSLALLIKRARESRQPIILTQKGYPSCVLLDIEVYTVLRSLADIEEVSATSAEATSAVESTPSEPALPENPSAKPARSGRRRSQRNQQPDGE
jgi:prevent-host-death family protein